MRRFFFSEPAAHIFHMVFRPLQPITTTSPPPSHLDTTKYRTLMGQHQISQGYHPSPSSMFYRPSHSLFSGSMDGPDPVAREPKTVSFPCDCLNRFTSIASINTARNRETCGLLLGKDKDAGFVVTTLLIPKQHSTNDTCRMDEKELVIQFTEERSLITLGWVRRHPYRLTKTRCSLASDDQIHTHPTQSCKCFQLWVSGPDSNVWVHRFHVVCRPAHT